MYSSLIVMVELGLLWVKRCLVVPCMSLGMVRVIFSLLPSIIIVFSSCSLIIHVYSCCHCHVCTREWREDLAFSIDACSLVKERLLVYLYF